MDEQRLARIEAQQERTIAMLQGLTEKVDERIAQSAAWRARVERTVYGDGNGNKGHNLRIDRLEQAQERRTWRERWILGLVAALACRALYDLLTAGLS